MAERVNLNRFRKAQKRAAEIRQAAENRVAFGRTKAERVKNHLETERKGRNLDGKKLD